ncbi:hypothetical protein FUAX_21330 [Fulvitalea axinellae]|uniref:OmpA-like domain-containing protein n=1 Tax=Fulvitalea axinellae TaxID=1182444 RepID=A0AAU9D9W7_9BACT|nr:hypothetical protein FUAX_21330 [Fulvitalea axinellae]
MIRRVEILKAWVVALTVFFVLPAKAQRRAVEKLGPAVNSPFDERYPCFSPDGSRLYFTRLYHPDNKGGGKDKGDVWYVELDEKGNPSPAKQLGGKVNNKSENQVLGFSPDGKKMYLAYKYGKNNGRSEGISVSKSKGRSWGAPSDLDFPTMKNDADQLNGSVSHDGKVMLLSMQSYGSYGAEDLYVSFFKNGKWSDPKNLGMTVNSGYQEMTPYLAADNKTLYFASNGHGGFGSYDIFKTERLDDSWTNWTKPQNLGEKVNSAGREYSYLIGPDGETAWYVSTTDSHGYGDIKRIKVQDIGPAPKQVAERAVLEANVEVPVKPEIVAVPTPVAVVETPEPATQPETPEVPAKPVRPVAEPAVPEGPKCNVLLRLRDETNGNDIAGAKVSVNGEVLTPTGSGAFLLSRETEGEIEVEAVADGYMVAHSSILVTKGKTERALALKPITVGSVVKLENVLFSRASDQFLKGSKEALNEVVRLMEENKDMVIEIGGHTDSNGTAKLKMKLSQDRADRVKRYLVEQGIEKRRVKAKGYGSNRPVASNKSEETRKLNRRVEFTILKK